VTNVLPYDCSHELVEPRKDMPAFASWDDEAPQNFSEWDAAWCARCEHYVRRGPGRRNWQAFMSPLDVSV
jgi:hypothetical protein